MYTGALEVFRSWGAKKLAIGGEGRGAIGAEVERRRREESSAAGARIEAPKAPRGLGCGEGVSPSPPGEGSGRGLCPLPRKFFDFGSQNGELSCILSGIF